MCLMTACIHVFPSNVTLYNYNDAVLVFVKYYFVKDRLHVQTICTCKMISAFKINTVTTYSKVLTVKCDGLMEKLID